MDYPILSRNVFRFPSVSPGFVFGLACILLAGCVQPKLPKSEIVRESGFDSEGRPLAYTVFPKTKFGNPDWVAAIEDGTLEPKAFLDSVLEPAGSILDLDIVFNVGTDYPVPHVVFPHAAHTMWLSCNSCHPAIFVMRQGANPVSMDHIIKGQYCGRCHGVVAFSIADCFRCHSRPKTVGILSP